MAIPRLDALTSPTRNHFFYGKLLDELHLRMEQDYFNGKRWLLNRLGLGHGVVCGLQVAVDRNVLCVDPGVAIDRLGREIVVPRRTCLDPWILSGDCTMPKKTLPRDQRQVVHVVLCYQECRSDFVPALVTDCMPEDGCEPSTIAESFCLMVREGDPPSLPPVDPRLCETLNKEGTAEEKRARLCELMSTWTCAPTAEDACVVLATVVLEADGTIGRVAMCSGRPQVYSNDLLFRLLLCIQGGTQGPKGDQGDKGEKGEKGDKGDAGANGTNGTNGTDGRDGVGLNFDLTKIDKSNWPNDGVVALAIFMKGLEVSFTRKVNAITPNGRAWFLVRVEYPKADEGTIVEQLVLEETIGLNAANQAAAFVPHKNFAPTFTDMMTKLSLERALVRVIIKSAFLIDEKKDPVDGDFLRGQFPTGDGVPGTDFESWFFLTR